MIYFVFAGAGFLWCVNNAQTDKYRKQICFFLKGLVLCTRFYSLFINFLQILAPFSPTTPSQQKIGYIHLVDGLGFGFHKLGEPFTLAETRKLLPKGVALIGNCG